MNDTAPRIDAWFYRLMPRSIVGRSTLAIIALAVIVGAIFGTTAALLMQSHEHDRLIGRLDELASTVEKTASVACYVNDQALAREIAAGLLSNRVVLGVRIEDATGVLVQSTQFGIRPDSIRQPLEQTFAIQSPFNAGEKVCDLHLISNEEVIRAEAWKYTQLLVLALALEVMLLAASVAAVVFTMVTRPIRSISDELHSLEMHVGSALAVPRGNARDEIGRLVEDVNGMIHELTHLIEQERELRVAGEVSKRKLAQIIEKVDAGIFVAECDGRLRSWNPAFEKTLGAPGETGTLQALIDDPEHPIADLIAQTLASQNPSEREVCLQRPDERDRWIELSLGPLDEDLVQGVINDVTERKHRELIARDMAERDVLTGVLNRRGFDAALTSVFCRSRHEPQLRIALLVVDLDRFKQVNDDNGHEAGDEVLRAVTARMISRVRVTDQIARFGGDEFAVMLLGAGRIDQIKTLADILIHDLSEPIPLSDGSQVQIGASIGISLIEPHDIAPEDVLQRADRAMYQAKRGGRGRSSTLLAQALQVMRES